MTYSIDDNIRFARQNRYGTSGPMRHAQVDALAQFWLPRMRFHEAERFHPIALAEAFDQVDRHLATLTPDERRALEISGRESPLIVSAEDGEVLGAGPGAAAATEDPAISSAAYYTHGASLSRSRKIFGADITVAGNPDPTAGDPRVPRLPIVVGGEMRMLIDVLEHELQLDGLELDPAFFGRSSVDALWGRFRAESLLFEPSGLGAEEARAVARRLIAAERLSDPVEKQAAHLSALATLPSAYTLVDHAWRAIRDFGFLEYTLFYAYNDYSEYADWPYSNEHEGDSEGFCLVFERALLEQYASGTLDVADVCPHTIITSVHEEFNGTDNLRRLPIVPARAREDLLVYVAVGSHATYLDPGTHDVISFENAAADLPMQLPGIALLGIIMAVGFGGLATLALLNGVLEHFVDAEDETSDSGVATGPQLADPAAPADPLHFDATVATLPLGIIDLDRNAYTEDRRALAIRAFPGIWGGHHGLKDHSAPWGNKTLRFLKRFLKSGEFPSGIIL